MGALVATLKSTLPRNDARASSTDVEQLSAGMICTGQVAVQKALAEYTRAYHGRSSSGAVLRSVRAAMETAQNESSTEQGAFDRVSRILKYKAKCERSRAKCAAGRAQEQRGTREKSLRPFVMGLVAIEVMQTASAGCEMMRKAAILL